MEKDTAGCRALNLYFIVGASKKAKVITDKEGGDLKWERI
jgi:hypothetical protein